MPKVTLDDSFGSWERVTSTGVSGDTRLVEMLWRLKDVLLRHISHLKNLNWSQVFRCDFEAGGGTWQWAGLLGGGASGPLRSAGRCASKQTPPRHRAAPLLLAASRTRGSKHPYVIRPRPRLSPPISSDPWTCSLLLRTRSMSRFPAVAGRAPRRQEEGERPIELQEERPSAVRIADRGAVRGTLWEPAGVICGAKSTSVGGRGGGEEA